MPLIVHIEDITDRVESTVEQDMFKMVFYIILPGLFFFPFAAYYAFKMFGFMIIHLPGEIYRNFKKSYVLMFMPVFFYIVFLKLPWITNHWIANAILASERFGDQAFEILAFVAAIPGVLVVYDFVDRLL